MDFGGINKNRPLAGIGLGQDVIIGNQQSHKDRDPSGQQYQQRSEDQEHQLSEEQEEEVLEDLNKNPSFLANGLQAEWKREEGKFPAILIRDQEGNVIRKLPYSQVVQSYLERGNHSNSGKLLRRSA